jgi:hypothetical protein
VKPKSIRRSLTLLGLVLIASSGSAQTLNLPNKLSGRWSTLDGNAQQSISVEIDNASAKGKLTVWSKVQQCTIREAPFEITVINEKIVFTVDPAWENMCRKNIVVELTKVADSNEYVGMLKQEGEMASRYPLLNVKMSP